jgi:tRNA 2-selenouridine synthase SelU
MTTSAEDLIESLQVSMDGGFFTMRQNLIRTAMALIASQAAEIERLTACIAEYIVQIDAQAAEIERLRAHIERGHEIHERLTNFSSHSMEWDMALDEAIAYLSPHAKSKAIDAIEP